MNLSQIRIEKRRHRKDMGDIRSLADSIKKNGLLQPPAVDGKGRLVAGARRVAAVRLLGLTDIPVRVLPELSRSKHARLLAERDENTMRKDYLPSELVSIARELEPLEKKEALERERSGKGADGSGGRGRKKKPGATFAQGSGRSREKIAAAIGLSHPSYAKARAVVEAAERDPARYGSLVVEMDGKKGNISAAFNKLNRLQYQAEAEKTRLVTLPKSVDIRHCSMADLLDSFHGQLDAIICDPMYDRGAIPVYGELAKHAKAALRPGGVLAVMCGQSYLPEILAAMTAHMPFRWPLALLTPGPSCQLWQRKVKTKWKPVLIFGAANGWISGDVISSADSGRKRHPYEQSEQAMIQLVERLTEKRALVCDPFLGSGTTAVACVKTGRRFVGCDTDASAIRITNKRLSDLSRESGRQPQHAKDVKKGTVMSGS